MQHYWWVNHKRTAQWEIGEGHLWSPKTEATGARSQFYENIRRAVPGEIVLSYANGVVGHIGAILRSAKTSPKPDYRNASITWNAEGWRLPVEWHELPKVVRPKEHW